MADLQLLVPLDGTPFSRLIVPAVTRLFPPDRFAVRLLFVAQAPAALPAAMTVPATLGPDMGLYLHGSPATGAAPHPIHDHEGFAEFRAELRETLEREITLFEDAGYRLSTTVLFGDPVDEIVALVEESGVDAVAMATHGRKGLSRYLLGSVALDALERLSVPVLLLRADDPEAAP